MTTQPEALRLADAIDYPDVAFGIEAAAELRRLHAENAELREANETFGRRQVWWNDRMFALEQQRDALLEALKLALSSHGVMLMSDPPQEAWKVWGVEEKARAAIKMAEEE